MTVSEFAEQKGIPYQTVIRWVRKNLIPGVKTTQFGRFKVYMIPDDAEVERPKTGRPPKPAEGAGDQAEPPAAEPPTKTKRRAAKTSTAKKASKTTRSRKAMKKAGKKATGD